MTVDSFFSHCLCFLHCLVFLPQQDEHENMQDMSIFDMSVVDEADNDNGIPAEVEEDKMQDSEELCDEDELLQDTVEQDKEKMGLEDASPTDEVSLSLMDV